MGEASLPAPEAHVIPERFGFLERTISEEFLDSRPVAIRRFGVALLPVDDACPSVTSEHGGDFGDFEAAIHADGPDVISQGK